MKRLIWFCSFFICVLLAYAQSSISEVYKKWIVEDINSGNFTRAVETINNTDLEYSNLYIYIDTLKMEEFLDSIIINEWLPANSIKIIQSNYIYALVVLGNYYVDNEDFYLSRTYLHKALQISDKYKNYGESYLTAIHQLGRWYRIAYMYEEAEYYYLKHLDYTAKIYGRKSISYAYALDNLSLLYREMCMFLKSEKYALRALSIEKKIQGDRSPDIAITLTNLANVYMSLEQYEKSIDYYQQSLDMIIKLFGENSQKTAIAYDNLGVVYKVVGNYKQARTCIEKSINIQKHLNLTDTRDFAISLGNLSSLYLNEKDTILAERTFIESIEIFKNVLGITHPQYISQLLTLASIEEDYGKYEVANDLLNDAQNIERTIHGDSTFLYAEILERRGILYLTIKDYNNAINYFQKAKEIFHRARSYDFFMVTALQGSCYYAIGKQDEAKQNYRASINTLKISNQIPEVDYYKNILSIADILSKNGEYQFADSCYNEIYAWYKKNRSRDNYIHILEKLSENAHNANDYDSEIKYINLRIKLLVNKDTDAIADAYNELGGAFMSIGEYEKALQYYESSMRYYEENAKDSLDMAIVYNNLSCLYTDIGNYNQAEHYAIKSFEIKKNILTINHPSYAAALNTLSVLYSKLNKFELALEYGLEASRLYKLNLGENADAYINSLCNNSIIYKNLGEFYESEGQLLTALNIISNLSVYNITTYGQVLLNLADLYTDWGNFDNAVKYYLRALQIAEEFNGQNSPSYFVTLHNLGLLYLENGEFSKGWDLIIKSLDIGCKIYGDNNINLAPLYSNLATILTSAGISEDSGILLLHAVKILKENNFSQSLDYIKVLYNIASYLNKYYKTEENAEHLFEICVNTSDSILGKNNPQKIIFLNSLGRVQLEKGKIENAYRTICEEMNVLKDHVISLNKYMTEKQRAEYNEKIVDVFYTPSILCFKSKGTNELINNLTYDNELFRKGLLLNSANAVRRSIFESGDTALIKQWNELTEAKQVVMHLEEKEPTSSQLDIYRHRADSLEKQMTISSAVFRESKEQWNINWESVKKQLSQNEVAIEYFSAPLSQDSTMYCALLLRHNSKYPELIPLFEEKEVASYLDKVTEGSTNNLYSFEGEGEYISNIVWSKILSKIKPGETIYFAPTGVLHQLAIEYLPVDSTRTMSDAYNMVRLSSTREIVTNKSKESYKSAVVYGGIHYDLDNKTILKESKHYPELKRRSLENDLINRGSAQFLPGTKEEAEKINKLLIDNKIEAKIFKTKTANEESFKSLSGKHNNILHIATHGFTWTDSTARKQDYFADRMQMQLMGDNQMRAPIIDPLDRCGLLFAGANTALQGKSKELPEGVQDGILTAKEISLMDLCDAELVVLSACETAKGDITSEGVFGLQRAFKMAGVQTIIMSLWKVNDEATKMLMTEFYTNWISKKQSKREAFRNAQNVVKKQYPEPSYWAGFVMLD